MSSPKKEVLIVVGSESDRERVAGAFKALDEAKVGYEFVVSSAHRNPDQTAELAKGVLTITLPKSAAAQKPEKKIEIKTAA